MKEICIINGSGGKGKDMFVEFCSKYCKVQNISAIDPSKNAAMDLVGYKWGDEKDNEEARALLSDLKALSIRYNNYPFQYVSAHIRSFLESDHELLFIHIREIPEIQQVLDNFDGVHTLLVTSKRVNDITSNPSDANVYNFDYEFTVANDDNLETLEANARNFVLTLMGKNGIIPLNDLK